MSPSLHHHRRRGIGCSVLAGVVLSISLFIFGLFVLAPAQGLFSGLSVLPGDADCDGRISVSDAVKLIEHIFQGKPIPRVCADSVTLYADDVLVIKRLVLPVDSTVYGSSYFSTSLLQKFLVFKNGHLVDSAAWLYQVIPLSLNRNIPPPESLGVGD